MAFKSLVLIPCLLTPFYCFGQLDPLDSAGLAQDLEQLITDLEEWYIYQSDKQVDFDCLRRHYFQQIEAVTNESESVLLFEYLLDEFYDSHLILNTNRKASYRLFAPVYATFRDEGFFLDELWLSQMENLTVNLYGAELLAINGQDIQQAIHDFPTVCNAVELPEIQEWIANKLLAGRYDSPRILKLKLQDGSVLELDLDELSIRKDTGYLSSKRIENFGYIRINNTLGENELIKAFDAALAPLMDTEGFILDLRNTPGGGNTYVAKGILSRFTDEVRPFQQHQAVERFDGETEIGRQWLEYIVPRAPFYDKPIVVLAGRWTGSVGEGIVVGFDQFPQAQIVGTELMGLAGAMFLIDFQHRNYGYRLSLERIAQPDGTPREQFKPKHAIRSHQIDQDRALEKALLFLKK
ncbi:MAG: S41 family peptidase [Bacteroidota bacterium]